MTSACILNMFHLSPNAIQYLPGLECEEEEDMFDEENAEMLKDTLHMVRIRTEHKHSLQVGSYINLTNITTTFRNYHFLQFQFHFSLGYQNLQHLVCYKLLPTACVQITSEENKSCHCGC